MQLTIALLFKRSVNGHIFRGKDRLVKRVSLRSMDTLRRQYEQEEENMALLSRPYLTLEQSSGHAKALGKREALMQKWQNNNLKVRPNITIADRLSHLKVKDAWD